MSTALDDPRQYLTGILENLITVERMAASAGMAPTGFAALHGLIPELERIVAESYPLSQLLDCSDIMIHAEGPGASRHLPRISSYSWVFQTVEKSVRHYFSNIFSGIVGLSKEAANQLDIRVSGFAPGSVWLGVKIEHNQFIMGENMGIWDGMPTLDMLPRIAENIGDEGMLPGIKDLELDPLFLDSSLTILKDLSPTGNKGIHTLEISTKKGGAARLGQRERVVISQALKGLLTSRQRKGSLTGVIRAADLDRSRLSLRSKDYNVVCLFPAFSAEIARSYLDKNVELKGIYETDKEGKPRRMIVESIQAIPSNAQLL
jgi:hypothetical protein